MDYFIINNEMEFNFKDPNSSEKYKKLRNKVFKIIKKYSLIKKNDKVLLALSGGKDSSVLALILRDFFIKNRMDLEKQLLALHIDVGIKLNEIQKRRAKALCEYFKIPFEIVKAPISIDNLYKKREGNVCNICGVQRRYLYTKVALEKKFNVVATGHDLDDEAESFIMNVLQNNWKAAVENYVFKESANLPRKIKPLIFVSNKETKEVAMDLNIIENKVFKDERLCLCDCPYSPKSFRYSIRKFLNSIKKEWDPSTLNKILSFSLKLHEEFNKTGQITKNNRKEIERKCKICGIPSYNTICKMCQIKEELGIKDKS